MKKYLPSKKFIKFMASVLALGLVIWLGAYLIGKKQVYQNTDANKMLASGAGDIDFYQKDSDRDGIYDWEEALWMTDPNKKDTNGDGISDGDEINSRKKEIREKNEFSDEVTPEEDLNQTEIFARQLFSAAALAREQGGVSSDSLEAFANSFGESLSETTIPDPFQIKDIKLEHIDRKEYETSLRKIFEIYTKSGISNSETIYNLSLGDKGAKAKIEKLAEIYNKMSNQLLKAKAPYDAAGIHLELINNTAKLSIAFINMRKLEDDPIIAVVGFRQYQEYSLKLENALISFNSYVSSSGIIN